MFAIPVNLACQFGISLWKITANDNPAVENFESNYSVEISKIPRTITRILIGEGFISDKSQDGY